MRRYWRADAVIFCGLWLVLALAGRSSLFRDPGTFWHTVAGQRILETGHVPRVDEFSCTFGGQPWVATQWLAECGMALVYDRLGWDGLLLGTVTLLAGLLTVVARRLMQVGLTTVPAVLTVTIVAAACSHHFHVRPHLATMLLLTLLVAALCDVESGKRAVRWLWWLVPLFVVWSNLHGGALAGWATLLLAACGWLTWWWMGWESPIQDRNTACQLGCIVVLCAGSMMVGPYGLDTPRTWVRLMSLDLPDLIEEHAPLNLRRPEGIVTLLLGAGYLAALASTWPRRPRVVWLLPFVWACLAISRVRHAPLFALTTGIALADLLPYSRSVAWLCRKGWWNTSQKQCQFPNARAWRPWVVPCGLVLAVALLTARTAPNPVPGQGWARFDPTIWPTELLTDLTTGADPQGQPLCMFNSLELGGFLTFYAPHVRTFIDDRCELFGGEFLQRYAAAEAGEPACLEQWAKEYGLQRALVRSGSPFDAFLAESSTWRLQHRTPAASLYERRDEASASATVMDVLPLPSRMDHGDGDLRRLP